MIYLPAVTNEPAVVAPEVKPVIDVPAPLL
jgi:hypothetical protein